MSTVPAQPDHITIREIQCDKKMSIAHDIDSAMSGIVDSSAATLQAALDDEPIQILTVIPPVGEPVTRPNVMLRWVIPLNHLRIGSIVFCDILNRIVGNPDTYDEGSYYFEEDLAMSLENGSCAESLRTWMRGFKTPTDLAFIKEFKRKAARKLLAKKIWQLRPRYIADARAAKQADDELKEKARLAAAERDEEARLVAKALQEIEFKQMQASTENEAKRLNKLVLKKHGKTFGQMAAGDETAQETMDAFDAAYSERKAAKAETKRKAAKEAAKLAKIEEDRLAAIERINAEKAARATESALASRNQAIAREAAESRALALERQRKAEQDEARRARHELRVQAKQEAAAAAAKTANGAMEGEQEGGEEVTTPTTPN